MSKQMSATPCSGQAVHPVKLLRDCKGVFGIIGHGDDDHAPRELSGANKGGHAWLHPACWRPWHDERRRSAISALVAINIGKPRKERS